MTTTTDATTTPDEPTMPRRVRYVCDECGQPLRKSYGEVRLCARCGRTLCEKHRFSYVDGNNIAISRHSPGLCRSCYHERYPNEWGTHPPRMADVIASMP